MPIAENDVRWVDEPKLGLFGQLYLPIVADGLTTTDAPATVIATGDDVVVCPRLSVATAVSE